MPRRRPDEVVVDPVAAAAQLGQFDPGPPVVTENVAHQCALGHPNSPDTRFCAQCGLPMDVPAPVPVSHELTRPKPAAMLTAEERAARDRQHAEAIRAAAAFDSAPVAYVQPEGDTILIHFVEDGFYALGTVWYRGQELEIGPSHPRWPQARGFMLQGDAEQMEQYGKVYFRRGPWPGQRGYEGAEFERLGIVGGEGTFAGPGEEALRQAEEAERRRGRAAPAPAFGAG